MYKRQAQASLKSGNQNRVEFVIDTIAILPNYDYGLIYTTNAINVYDVNKNQLVYSENPKKYVSSNLIYVDSLGYWTLNYQSSIYTDVFDGIQLKINQPLETSAYDYANSGWVNGNGIMRVTPTKREAKYMPWDYEIIFSNDPSAYKSVTTSKLNIRDESDNKIITNQLLLDLSCGFFV